jgi:hypothetical protein
MVVDHDALLREQPEAFQRCDEGVHGVKVAPFIESGDSI